MKPLSKHLLRLSGIAILWLGLAPATLAAVSWGDCTVASGGDSSLAAGLNSYSTVLNPTIPDNEQAFVLGTGTGFSGVTNSRDHLATAELDTSSTLVITRGGTTGDVYFGGSIIQCTGGDKIKVQRGTLSLLPGEDRKTGNFTDPVADVDNAIVLITTRTDDATPNDSASLVTASLQNTNTVIVQRAAGSANTVYAHYQVVEFLTGSGVTVQTDEVTLASGESTHTVTLPIEAPTDRTWVYCNYDATDNGLQQTAVACHLSDSTTLTVTRASAGAYTNRIRVYAVTWPADTVTVATGTSSIDPTVADDTVFDDDIAIPAPGADATRSFAYITHTTAGTGNEYPRHTWVNYILNSTTLRSTFGRSDASGNSDATTKYWQVVNFPAPFGATGWGYIINSTDGVDPTAMISFSCSSIETDATWLTCGDGSSGTRQDYGVQFEQGGCADVCDVTGQAWIGSINTVGETSGMIGMIDFDPTISGGASVPANVVGDDGSTTEDEQLDAHWNEETGELYGWARIRSLRDYEATNGGTADDWGWINLRGTSGAGVEYGVRFDAADLALSGWGWNGNGTEFTTTNEADGSGFGWLKFDLDTSGSVTDAWLRTTQANVYSQGGFLSTVDPTAFGEYNATYLIVTSGDSTTITGFATDPLLGNEVVNTDLGGVPTDNTSQVFRGDLGSIYVNELIDQATTDGHAITGDCSETMLTGATNPMGGAVYYCSGDLTISNNVTFYNGTGSGVGSGTIVVGGDLYINDNLNYYNNSIDQHINNLASVAFIVNGSVAVGPSVTELVGAYVVLGNSDFDDNATYDNSTFDFVTGDSTLPLELNGLVMARSFNFQRRSLGSITDEEPSEDFRYDGRVLANPPPGLADFASVFPTYQ